MKEMNKVLFQIKLFPRVGSFAEDKDVARELRLSEITPLLKKNEEIILNFDKIDSTIVSSKALYIASTTTASSSTRR